MLKVSSPASPCCKFWKLQNLRELRGLQCRPFCLSRRLCILHRLPHSIGRMADSHHVRAPTWRPKPDLCPLSYFIPSFQMLCCRIRPFYGDFPIFWAHVRISSCRGLPFWQQLTQPSELIAARWPLRTMFCQILMIEQLVSRTAPLPLDLLPTLGASQMFSFSYL